MLYLTDLGAGAQIYQDSDGYAFSQDSVLLANLAKISPDDRLLDLGCGSGILCFLTILKKGVRSCVGVDVQAQMCDMSTKSALLNGWQDNFTAICGDVKDIRKFTKAESFDKVVCNPPYFTSSVQADSPRKLARFESSASLADFVAAAAYCLKFGGELNIIVKFSRLATLFFSLVEHNLQPKEATLIYPKLSAGVDSVIVRAKKGGKEGMSSSTLIVKDEDDNYTSAFKELYD